MLEGDSIAHCLTSTLTAVFLNMQVFTVVMTCWSNSPRRVLLDCFAPKMLALRSFETSVTVYKSPRRCNLEHLNIRAWYIFLIKPELCSYEMLHTRDFAFGQPFLGTFAKLRIATISFFVSVCPSVCLSAWNNSAPTGRLFMKFDI